ncbi:hypothetical protein AHMF7605_10375 [Adhaeribacter arboris]|uniref:Uncharacterized protein n=1 Tax=Adhaeribacter arboris TaxID=2072846 RepID=A0A2T2YEI0_9BACT|nr:hypothetical protein [Adhaeribacter arboris]PSR53893.1 hypothetical protein AHMF7605_10375 [Adhaeribacter arboris]
MKTAEEVLNKYTTTLSDGTKVCPHESRLKAMEEYADQWKPLPSLSIMFDGEYSEQYNALQTALFYAAEGEENVYTYLNTTPKTSLVVELIQALHHIGYSISKFIPNEN